MSEQQGAGENEPCRICGGDHHPALSAGIHKDLITALRARLEAAEKERDELAKWDARKIQAFAEPHTKPDEERYPRDLYHTAWWLWELEQEGSRIDYEIVEGMRHHARIERDQFQQMASSDAVTGDPSYALNLIALCNSWIRLALELRAIEFSSEAADRYKKERDEAVALLREALPEIRPGKSCPCSACHHLRGMKGRIGALVGREGSESPPQG